MRDLFDLPLFGIILTILVYFFARRLYQWRRLFILNPVLISVASIIWFLEAFDLSLETYNKGGRYLTFFLGPAVVALGAFFYEKYEEVKQDLKLLFIAVIAGGICGVVSITFFLIILELPEFLIRSLASKSVTTPIAIEITKVVGGIPDITAGIVIAVGIFGNALGPFFLKLLKIKNAKAIGAALGTAAHGIGTARAIEEGQIPGIYSGIAMCLNGVITAGLTPLILYFFL